MFKMYECTTPTVAAAVSSETFLHIYLFQQRELHKEQFLPSTHPAYKRVVNVANRLIKSNKEIPQLQRTKWLVTVVNEPSITNAFVLPVSHLLDFFCPLCKDITVFLHIHISYAGLANTCLLSLIKCCKNTESCNDMKPLTQCEETLQIYLQQGYRNPRHDVTKTTKFCTVVSNICGPSVWNLFHVTLMAPRLLKLLPDFCKIYTPVFDMRSLGYPAYGPVIV
jgi:hypothetical protein